jgi:hypothetical protein
MSVEKSVQTKDLRIKPNGSGGAAVLAGGIGSILLAIFSAAADKYAAL